MLRPFVFLFGYTKYSFPSEISHLVAELCRQKKRVYRGFCFQGDEAYVEIPLPSARAFERDCRAANIPVALHSRHGLPPLLWGYRKRLGLIVGAVFFLLLSTLSGSVLWDVRVEGNSRLSDREVVELLEECGLTVGMRVKGIPTPQIETLALINSEDIAWISINILGSVAEVHIIEDSGEPVEDVLGSDIVAERGGVIQWLEDIRGWQAVEIGQQVEKGQLLLGGSYPAEEGMPTRYTTPKGRVFALTERDFSVSIPLKYEKKVYTGSEKVEKYFIFFKKEVKFFENCGKMYAEYDTIDTVEYFTLPHGIVLPFGIRTVRHSEYERDVAVRSEESAVELALYTLRCRMDGEVPEGMLTKKKLTGSFTDTTYELFCKAEYIEDIALRRVAEDIIKKETEWSRSP